MSIIQGPFSVAPCQTLVSRFATFSSLYRESRSTDLLSGRWAPVLIRLRVFGGAGSTHSQAVRRPVSERATRNWLAATTQQQATGATAAEFVVSAVGFLLLVLFTYAVQYAMRHGYILPPGY